ncbi:MAG: hypothetical protein HPY57_13040 [Ignavibacteria bacterium]|nr:hypothetical protein [Ignavibacteria bacterium]
MNPKQQFYKILLSYGLDVRVTQRDAQSSAFVSIYKVNEKADDVDRNLELLTRLKELPDFKYFAFRFKDRSGIERIVPVSSMSPRRGQWRETANGSKFWSATQLLAAVGANTLEFDIISLERDKLDVQETTVQPKNEIEVL